MIPGSNLLRQAMRIIGGQGVLWFRNTGRTTTDAGLDVPEYAPPVFIDTGSVQPIDSARYDSARYAQMGLDMEKVYILWFVPADVVGVKRDLCGDVIEWNGGRWQCRHDLPWFGQDGWKQVTCVRVGDAHAG
ncbi:MAG: hypothetical protein LBF51_07300 [Zoogloeaceae bacterium]|jgi:hypothetical protein|nr:hypothetical protein [Zoogloeaceae bacterium]